MQLWDAFLEDYRDEIFDWSPRQLLEIFWHYCQDGSKAVYEFLNKDAVLTSAMHLDGEGRCTCRIVVPKDKTGTIDRTGCPIHCRR